MNTSPHALNAAARLSMLTPGHHVTEAEAVIQEAIDAVLEASGFGRSAMSLPYQLLIGSEGCGTYGAFGVRIAVAHSALPNLSARRDLDNETPEEKAFHHAAYEAEDLIKGAVMTLVLSKDPKAQAQRVAERAQLIGLFPAGSYVEEIPNGYDSGWACKHLPWFKVTTQIGRFTIGWRRRVINLDWSECPRTKTAAELFPNEDVTKGERYIHASVEKAAAYIAAVTNGTPL